MSQGYFVQLLDDLPEQLGNPTVRDINALGQLAGRSDVDGSITNLDDNNQEQYSEGYGINDAGDVVGHFEWPDVHMGEWDGLIHS